MERLKPFLRTFTPEGRPFNSIVNEALETWLNSQETKKPMVVDGNYIKTAPAEAVEIVVTADVAAVGSPFWPKTLVADGG